MSVKALVLTAEVLKLRKLVNDVASLLQAVLLQFAVACRNRLFGVLHWGGVALETLARHLEDNVLQIILKAMLSNKVKRNQCSLQLSFYKSLPTKLQP